MEHIRVNDDYQFFAVQCPVVIAPYGPLTPKRNSTGRLENSPNFKLSEWVRRSVCSQIKAKMLEIARAYINVCERYFRHF
ncbi:MAG: hypothetical protein ACI9LO_001744 [Planctomycetota bacterium]